MKGSLMVHMRVAHGSGKLTAKKCDGNKSLECTCSCSSCSKLSTKEQSLQNIKPHEGKQHECDVCFKMFTTKYFLKKHKRLHTGETPYSCSQCSKTFTFQQSYHKHLLYHSNEKPHVCPECDRAFRELSTLHNHQRIHTGEKPFTCETCGKCFRQRVSYLVHKRIHTGVMPYKCTACGKSFRYKVSQRTHKCPSQPPGTVVRQTGELIQKLLKQKQSNTHMVSVIDEFSLNDQQDSQSLSQQEQHNTASIDKNIVPPNEQTSSNYSMDLHSTSRDHLENIVKDSLQYRSPIDSLNTNNVSNRLEICIDGISSNQQSRLYETCNKETEKEPPENPLPKSNKPMCHTILKENNVSLESPVHMNTRVLENEQSLPINNKSCHISEATDFFRMVMSPHITSLPSSSEILNISLPSSSLAGSYQTSLNENVHCQYSDKNIQQRFNRRNTFENETKNMLQVRAENAELNMTPTTSDRSVIGQNNSKEIETMETLQKEILETINLESLKQILYGQCQ